MATSELKCKKVTKEVNGQMVSGFELYVLVDAVDGNDNAIQVKQVIRTVSRDQVIKEKDLITVQLALIDACVV